MMTDLLIRSGASISGDGCYRYSLWRIWDDAKPPLVWIMLNPSTATAEQDDATIRVCAGRARRMGFGGIRVANLFNWRATDPSELHRVADPVGPQGDRALYRVTLGAPPMIIAAWGDGGAIAGTGYLPTREAEAVDILCRDYSHSLHTLGLTRAGHPRHPLRVPYSVMPTLWREAYR
jgi:hypothetical protein